MRTVGVEEEYLLVGPDGVPVAVAGAVIALGRTDEDPEPGGRLEAELKQQQVEIGTRPRTDLTEVSAEIRAGRARAQAAAAAVGARIAALATSPLEVSSTISPMARSVSVHRQFALTSREQLTCGCHVHVSVTDETEAVGVVDRIGPWLPVLLALTANSPFWQGEDTGYACVRAPDWNRWPTAGPTAPFGSPEAYHHAVAALVGTGAILDVGMVYFDARLSAKYPTVEVRVADVCLHPDDATLTAALSRALVETAAREHADGIPVRSVRPEVVRAAGWRASRSGLAGDLVSPLTLEPVPAAEAVDQLLDHIRDALVDAGDDAAVSELLGALMARGNGAGLQRSWFAESADLATVVERAADLTSDP